mmetsp:Transcript_14794/g.26207  ORF Transcript_14794/g.26207 Transcript_14794/m.26207 type:complete len:272 (+) Transcript_14794:740-1555(+)
MVVQRARLVRVASLWHVRRVLVHVRVGGCQRRRLAQRPLEPEASAVGVAAASLGVTLAVSCFHLVLLALLAIRRAASTAAHLLVVHVPVRKAVGATSPAARDRDPLVLPLSRPLLGRRLVVVILLVVVLVVVLVVGLVFVPLLIAVVNGRLGLERVGKAIRCVRTVAELVSTLVRKVRVLRSHMLSIIRVVVVPVRVAWLASFLDHALYGVDVLRRITIEHGVVVRPAVGTFGDPPETVQVELALERGKLRVAKVLGQHDLTKLVLVDDHE